MQFGQHSVDPVFLGMKIIKAKLELNDKKDREANRNANRKTGNIDEGEILIPPQIPERCF